MIWTEEAVRHLKTRAAERVSYSIIARELGTSRNSVIGKATRLCLPARPRKPKKARLRRGGAWDDGLGSGIKRKARLAGSPKPPKVPIVKRSGPLPEPPSLNLALPQLTDATCKWANGEGPYLFCGQPSIEGSSYCQHHHDRVWTPAPKRLR